MLEEKQPTEDKKDSGSDRPQSPIPGEFANFVNVTSSNLQTILDFIFVQPSPTGEEKTAMLVKRIILPPPVIKELSKILNKHIQGEEKKPE